MAIKRGHFVAHGHMSILVALCNEKKGHRSLKTFNVAVYALKVRIIFSLATETVAQ